MVNCGCFDKIYEHSDDNYNDIKENISLAYLSSICAFLEFDLQHSSRLIDKAKTDCTITAPRGKFDIKSIKIDVQLKCTSSPKFDKKGENLLFSINCELYRMIRSTKFDPLLLFVHILPEEVGKWVTVGEKELTVSEIMLWYSAAGSLKEPEQGQKSIQVEIPLKNVVTADSLHKLLKKRSENMVITNED
jgi:hypothetical protein